MVIAEYDKECDCEFCDEERQLRKRESARHLQSQKETMDKYHAEIVRFVDAAQIHCPDGFRLGMACAGAIGNCPFRATSTIKWCNLRMMVSFVK